MILTIDPNDRGIPEEILQYERKQIKPARVSQPGLFGIPALPSIILDLIIKYGPLLVLCLAVQNGFSAVGSFITLHSMGGSSSGTVLLSAFMSFVAAVFMLLSYIWLTQKLRLGWNTLAFAFIIQFLSRILISGVSSLLYSVVTLILTAHVMLQLRDHYSA